MILLATPLCNYGRGFCLIDVGTEGNGRRSRNAPRGNAHELRACSPWAASPARI